jgi:hypothetical protein
MISDQICIFNLFSIVFLFSRTSIICIYKCNESSLELHSVYILIDGKIDKMNGFFISKNPSKFFLMGFCILLCNYYTSKSKTKDGNKPKAIFNTIAITATA